MDWKKLGRRVLYPHPVATALLAVIAAAALIYSLALLEATAPVSIAAYTLSFYATLTLGLRIPDLIAWVQRFRQENRYYLLYRSDVQLRMNISLWGAFGFNAVYALFQLCLGLWHHSAWFYAMAVYYLLLACMRLMLARNVRTHAPGEALRAQWRIYRLCGALLLVMSLTLAVFVLYFVYRIREFRHHEITTIAMAVYTFAALALAIVNAVRYRKYANPAYSAAKAISLASATVSVLTLENAMLTAFDQDGSDLFRQIMLGATGSVVLLFVVGMAVYMIVRACKKLTDKELI